MTNEEFKNLFETTTSAKVVDMNVNLADKVLSIDFITPAKPDVVAKSSIQITKWNTDVLGELTDESILDYTHQAHINYATTRVARDAEAHQ